MKYNYTTINLSESDHIKLLNEELYMLRWEPKTLTLDEIKDEFNSLGGDERSEYTGFEDYLNENYMTFNEWCDSGEEKLISIL